MTPQELGALGEYHIAQRLRFAGKQVKFDGPADLLVDGKAVEVKTARLRQYRTGRRLGYQFCLTKQGHTDHTKASVVILLCWESFTVFIIPVEYIGERCKITIPVENPTRYNGLWSAWRERWEILAD